MTWERFQVYFTVQDSQDCKEGWPAPQHLHMAVEK